MKENTSSDETLHVDVGNAVAESKVDDGAEMLSLHLNKKDFEKISQTEHDESDSSPKNNMVQTKLSTWMIRRQLSWTIQTYKAAAEIQNLETNIV